VGPLSNDEVIRRVSQDFVPAAINLYRVRQASDGGRELFLSIQRQKDQYQGIWIVSPDGKVLAGKHDYKDFKNGAAELLETIDAGLASFGPVQPRRAQPAELDSGDKSSAAAISRKAGPGATISDEMLSALLPFRGKGVRDDGSVDLALYIRQVLGGGRGTIPAGVEPGRAWLWDGPYRTDGPTVIDTVSLSATDWRTFAPTNAEPGASWRVPERVARAFTRLLTASSDQSAMPQTEDATLAELECKVESISGGQARIQLSGRWEMVHAIEQDKNRLLFGAATARGVAVYDAETRSLRSFQLVFDGTIRHGRADASPNRTGAVAEWSSK
jgi:hypothetical protein